MCSSTSRCQRIRAYGRIPQSISARTMQRSPRLRRSPRSSPARSRHTNAASRSTIWSIAAAAIEAGRAPGAPAADTLARLLLLTGVDGLRRADVEADRHRIRNGLALSQIVQEVNRLVAHLEWPLSNLPVAQACLQIIHLHRQSLDEEHDQIFLVHPILVLAHELLVGLDLHLRSAACIEHRIDLRIFGQEVGELSDR